MKDMDERFTSMTGPLFTTASCIWAFSTTHIQEASALILTMYTSLNTPPSSSLLFSSPPVFSYVNIPITQPLKTIYLPIR